MRRAFLRYFFLQKWLLEQYKEKLVILILMDGL